MYEPSSSQHFADESRMSKAWIAANFDRNNNMTSSYNVNHHNHNHGFGLSSSNNSGRQQQQMMMTTPSNRSSFMASKSGGFHSNNINMAPPLVTSTPYTRQIGGQQSVISNNTNSLGPARLSSNNGVATISYHPARNAPISASARFYQREDVRGASSWQPPSSQRQPVVAFKKTPIYYDSQQQQQQQERKPNTNIYYDSTAAYLNAPIGMTRSVPPVKRNIPPLPPSQNYNHHSHHHQSSSGGDSCCSSCCSLSSSSNNQEQPSMIVNSSRPPPPAITSRPQLRERCDSTSFSCSSSCSCCSCQNNNNRNKKTAAPTNNKPPPPAPIMKQQQQQQAIMYHHHRQSSQDDGNNNWTSGTLTNNSKQVRQSRAARRRTIACGIDPSDLFEAQQYAANNSNNGRQRSHNNHHNRNNETTPTPCTPPGLVYSNDNDNGGGTLSGRQSISRTPVTMKVTPATTSSRDSGIGGVLTPPSNQLFPHQESSTAVVSVVPNYAQPATLINRQNNNKLVKTSSGSIKSSQSSCKGPSGVTKVVGKTIAVAGDIDNPHSTTTIYATTVQTPTSLRSTRSSMLMRLEVQHPKQQLQQREDTLGRNSSISSAATSSSSQMMRNPPALKMSAGGQVSVANSATRCVPVASSKDRFIWVDGNYDDAESPAIVKTAVNAATATVPNDRKPPPSNGSMINHHSSLVIPLTHHQQNMAAISNNNNNNNNYQRPVLQRKAATTVIRKHSSFFRNILKTLFGIKPKQHSDGDTEDPNVNPDKSRQMPRRSASAVFMRSANKQPSRPNDAPNVAPPKSSASFYSHLNVDDERTATNDRNRTWHGLKAYSKRKKADMRHVFDQVNSKTKQATTSNSNLSNKSVPVTVVINNNNDDDLKSTYTSLSKDDGSSTLGRQSNVGGATSTLSRPLSRGTSLASTLKSTSASARGGPLFLVKRRVGSSSNLIAPVPQAAPKNVVATSADSKNQTSDGNDTAIIANVEQLLAMARAHPTLEYEWIPDDYFI